MKNTGENLMVLALTESSVSTHPLEAAIIRGVIRLVV